MIEDRLFVRVHSNVLSCKEVQAARLQNPDIFVPVHTSLREVFSQLIKDLTNIGRQVALIQIVGYQVTEPFVLVQK